MAVLTAFLMSLTLASAASAHDGATGTGVGTTPGATNYQGCLGESQGVHDDANGVPCSNTGHGATHPGSGIIDSVENDSPADAVNVIRDYGLENAPIIIGVIGAIFLVGLTFYLVRRGLMKARGAMRL